MKKHEDQVELDKANNKIKVYRELADAQIEAIATMMSVSNLDENRSPSQHISGRQHASNTMTSHI